MSTTLSGSKLGNRLILAAIIALAIIWVAPLVWVFALSFKPNEFLSVRTDVLFSPPFTLKNYQDIIGSSDVFGWIVNSMVVSIGQTFLTLVLASLAGYGFARTEFPGKQILFVFVLAGLAVPEQAVVIPLHRLFAEFDLHNTYSALILPRLAAPFGVYLMTGYFKAIPRDIGSCAARQYPTLEDLPARAAAADYPGAGHARHLHLPDRLERLSVAADFGVTPGHVHADARSGRDADQLRAGRRHWLPDVASGLRRATDLHRLSVFPEAHRFGSRRNGQSLIRRRDR